MAKTSRPKEAVYFTAGGRESYQGYPAVNSISDAAKVMVLDPTAAPESKLIGQGFKWLGRWDIIAPFRPYRELAADLVKGKTEREIAALKIGDLRVPVFDPRLIFIKTTPETRKLWEVYQQHKKNWDARIAFLAAVWEIKPLIKPLPAGRWINTNGQMGSDL